jgi:hypothetical protein
MPRAEALWVEPGVIARRARVLLGLEQLSQPVSVRQPKGHAQVNGRGVVERREIRRGETSGGADHEQGSRNQCHFETSVPL